MFISMKGWKCKLHSLQYFFKARPPELTTAGLAETVGQVGHLPYHFVVVYDVAIIFIRDSEVG